jgi:hypothetical protein
VRAFLDLARGADSIPGGLHKDAPYRTRDGRVLVVAAL